MKQQKVEQTDTNMNPQVEIKESELTRMHFKQRFSYAGTKKTIQGNLSELVSESKEVISRDGELVFKFENDDKLKKLLKNKCSQVSDTLEKTRNLSKSFVVIPDESTSFTFVVEASTINQEFWKLFKTFRESSAGYFVEFPSKSFHYLKFSSKHTAFLFLKLFSKWNPKLDFQCIHLLSNQLPSTTDSQAATLPVPKVTKTSEEEETNIKAACAEISPAKVAIKEVADSNKSKPPQQTRNSSTEIKEFEFPSGATLPDPKVTKSHEEAMEKNIKVVEAEITPPKEAIKEDIGSKNLDHSHQTGNSLTEIEEFEFPSGVTLPYPKVTKGHEEELEKNIKVVEAEITPPKEAIKEDIGSKNLDHSHQTGNSLTEVKEFKFSTETTLPDSLLRKGHEKENMEIKVEEAEITPHKEEGEEITNSKKSEHSHTVDNESAFLAVSKSISQVAKVMKSHEEEAVPDIAHSKPDQNIQNCDQKRPSEIELTESELSRMNMLRSLSLFPPEQVISLCLLNLMPEVDEVFSREEELVFKFKTETALQSFIASSCTEGSKTLDKIRELPKKFDITLDSYGYVTLSIFDSNVNEEFWRFFEIFKTTIEVNHVHTLVHGEYHHFFKFQSKLTGLLFMKQFYQWRPRLSDECIDLINDTAEKDNIIMTVKEDQNQNQENFTTNCLRLVSFL